MKTLQNTTYETVPAVILRSLLLSGGFGFKPQSVSFAPISNTPETACKSYYCGSMYDIGNEDTVATWSPSEGFQQHPEAVSYSSDSAYAYTTPTRRDAGSSPRDIAAQCNDERLLFIVTKRWRECDGQESQFSHHAVIYVVNHPF